MEAAVTANGVSKVTFLETPEIRDQRHWLIIDGWHRINALRRLADEGELRAYPNVRILNPGLSEEDKIIVACYQNRGGRE